MIKIRLAISKDVPLLAGLFNDYRVFYQQASDPDAASAYLLARLAARDSLVWVAEADGELLGFTQVYPSWCSVELLPLWHLYDLYVSPSARGRGVGEQLLDAAKNAALAAGACRLELATAVDNHSAQRLYERNGWIKEADFFRFSFNLPQ